MSGSEIVSLSKLCLGGTIDTPHLHAPSDFVPSFAQRQLLHFSATVLLRTP
jgi:hypothetical protein